MIAPDDDRAMSEPKAARGSRRAAQAMARIGEEIRTARLGAGLTLRQVGSAVGVSASEVSRIERAKATWVSFVTLFRTCAVVGLDLWSRTYPGGEPLRDVAHLTLLNGFRRLVAPGIAIRTEVPIGDPRDLRAWDVVMTDATGGSCGVELEVRLVDAQDLARRIARKRRDSGLDVVVLVVAETRANRLAVLAASGIMAGDFPSDATSIKTELAAGRVPHRGGIVFVPIHSRWS